MKVPVNTPLFSGNELKYLEDCIQTGWVSSEGPFVDRFEKEMADYAGRKHAVAVSNGTAALDITIEALDLSKGDEIIVPSLTIISCIQQIVRKGLVPVFVDCDLDTFNLDPNSVVKAITNKTKAVLAVHIYGLAIDMPALSGICNAHGLYLIEDAAEVIGQTINGVKCGSFGLASTFSFYPNKHITTGEGGMILTDDDDFAEKARYYRNLCFTEDRFVHQNLGWNYRLTNLQAALGCAQLENLKSHVHLKRQIGAKYNEGINNALFTKPLPYNNVSENIYWVYPLVSRDASVSSKIIRRKLGEIGIGSRPFFYPLHLQPVLKKFPFRVSGSLKNSEHLYEFGLYIPSGLGLDIEQQDYVIQQINDLTFGK
jgi:perosamine synthetase